MQVGFHLGIDIFKGRRMRWEVTFKNRTTLLGRDVKLKVGAGFEKGGFGAGKSLDEVFWGEVLVSRLALLLLGSWWLPLLEVRLIITEP